MGCESFNKITALFGVSYINPKTEHRVKSQLSESIAKIILIDLMDLGSHDDDMHIRINIYSRWQGANYAKSWPAAEGDRWATVDEEE